MCFIKKSSMPVVPPAVREKPVERHQADATATKPPSNDNAQGYRQSIKTSIIGLTDEANVQKKTLLGE